MKNKTAGFSMRGYSANSKFNNADVERVLRQSHYFLKLVAPLIPGSITTGLLSLGALKEDVYKNNTHT
jgi:hypothetical protein